MKNVAKGVTNALKLKKFMENGGDDILYIRDRLNRYKIAAKKAAKDFRYGKTCIARIDAAKTEDEISKIMREYRIKKFEPEAGVASESLLVYRSSSLRRSHGALGAISAIKLT